MEPIRSLLFVPGNRQKMLDKARDVPADVLVPDLEDSVPPEEKAAARKVVAANLAGFAIRGQHLFVRINALSTGLGEEDLDAVLGPQIEGISVGKADSATDLVELDRLLGRMERRKGLPAGSIAVIPWIESALGIISAHDIARASPRIVAISFGADDFTADMGIPRTKEGTEQFYPRAAVAIAARAAGVMAFDTPFVDFRDEEGLARDCASVRQLGYTGKWCIHPGQVATVNRLFTPSEEEVAYCRRVAAAFDEAVARGTAATSVDGRMIDVPGYQRAQRILDLAAAIARRERGGAAGGRA
ncbi:MAG: CoA ester lyase [Chloroflexi bacterium]|nr:CoA ester lyase [Chloroflexota bacterium]